jgi:hypothetical protein
MPSVACHMVPWLPEFLPVPAGSEDMGVPGLGHGRKVQVELIGVQG